MEKASQILMALDIEDIASISVMVIDKPDRYHLWDYSESHKPVDGKDYYFTVGWALNWPRNAMREE